MAATTDPVRKKFEEGEEKTSWRLFGKFKVPWTKGLKTQLKQDIEQSFQDANVEGSLHNVKDQAGGGVVVSFEFSGSWLTLHKLLPLLDSKYGGVTLQDAETLPRDRTSTGTTEIKILAQARGLQQGDDDSREKLSMLDSEKGVIGAAVGSLKGENTC